MVAHPQGQSESIHSVIPAEDFISFIEMSEKYAAFEVPNFGSNLCMSFPKNQSKENLQSSLTLDNKVKEANERKAAILQEKRNSMKLRLKSSSTEPSNFDDQMNKCKQSFHEERLRQAEIRRNEQLKKVIERARDYTYCVTTLINYEENLQNTKELIERKLKMAEMRRQVKLQNRIEIARRRTNSLNSNDKDDESLNEMKIEAYEQKLKQAEERRLEKMKRKLDRIRYRSYMLSTKQNDHNDNIVEQSKSMSLAFEIKFEPPKSDLKAYPKRLIDKFFTSGLTHEEIQTKLEIAEQRRNLRLQKRINQIANRLCAYRMDSVKQNETKSLKTIDDDVSCDENGRTIAFQMMESPKVYFTAVPKRLYCNSKRPILTHDGIEMKLQEAEKRRQEKQQLKLEKRKKFWEEFEKSSQKDMQAKREELDDKMRRVAERKKAYSDARIERMKNNIEQSFKIDVAFQRLLQNEAWKKGLAGTEHLEPLSEIEIDDAVNEVVHGINKITKKLDKDIEHAKNSRLEELNAVYII